MNAPPATRTVPWTPLECAEDIAAEMLAKRKPATEVALWIKLCHREYRWTEADVAAIRPVAVRGWEA